MQTANQSNNDIIAKIEAWWWRLGNKERYLQHAKIIITNQSTQEIQREKGKNISIRTRLIYIKEHVNRFRDLTPDQKIGNGV